LTGVLSTGSRRAEGAAAAAAEAGTVQPEEEAVPALMFPQRASDREAGAAVRSEAAEAAEASAEGVEAVKEEARTLVAAVHLRAVLGPEALAMVWPEMAEATASAMLQAVVFQGGLEGGEGAVASPREVTR
jgi:hypothetical protein